MQHPSLDVIAQHLSEQLRCEQEDLCHQSLLGSGSEKQDGPLKVITMEKEVQASLMHHWRFGQSEPDVVGAYCSSVPHEPFHRFLFQLLSVAPLESPPGRPPRAGLVASGLFTISLKGGSWAELLKPARTLVTPHIMGRPPGLPHRHEQQLAVIRAALRLLETADHAPAIETFPS